MIAWVALYTVGQVVVVHLVAELTPVYLTEVFDAQPDTVAWSAMTNGLVTAVVAIVAALSQRWRLPLSMRIGLAAMLVALALVPTALIATMAVLSTAWLVPLLSLRRVQAAAASVLVPGLVAARVPSEHRAALLSMPSLGGRLGYTVALLAMASAANGDLDGSLWIATGVTAGFAVAIASTRRLVPDLPARIGHDHDHVHVAVSHDHVHNHADGHHGHRHDPPVTGAHRHHHRHREQRHRHAHTADTHHRHEH